MASCKEKAEAKPSGKTLVKVNSTDGSCCICCGEMSIFAVGACDHPICYKCSARMRVLTKQTYCPTCRAEMKQVILSFQQRKFAEFNLKNMKGKEKVGGFLFEEWRLVDAFDTLFENACWECGAKEKPFKTFEELRTHVRRAHEKQFCQICLDSLSNFPYELKMYTKKEMVMHRKEGDSDDKSHRGHPECKFCSDRFLDNDTLLLHLRKSHFWCHFCEGDGKQEYYNVYKDLRTHFAEFHFLCDEGECRNEKFTSVFREQIDYQAHKLAQHGKDFNKMQAKEARKIEFDYSYRKRQQPPSSVVTGADYAEVQSSDSRHGKGDSSKHRMREDQNKLNFSHFQDVERDRDELREKKLMEKGRNVIAGGGNSRKQNEQIVCADDLPLPEYRDYRLQPQRDYNHRVMDDDVIGMPEHINRRPEVHSNTRSEVHSNANQNVNIIEEKPKEKPKRPDSSPKLKKVEPLQKPAKMSDDFPSLPGAVSSPDLRQRAKEKKQEDFPALGQSVKPDFPALGQSVQPVRPKEAKSQISHVAGIPVTVKKPKEKGKSWTQQSGRANLKIADDFPSLNPLLGGNNKVESDKKPDKKPTNKTSSWQTERKPPGFEKQVNGDRQVNGVRTCVTDKPTTVTSAHTGRGPPGLGASGTRLKDTAPPGLPPGFISGGGTTPAPSTTASSTPTSSDRNENNSRERNTTSSRNENNSRERNMTSSRDENNLRERNMRLWTLLQTYLDNFNLQIFKSCSGEFRKDVISAAEYYSTISELLGDNLKFVFSELVALLPDDCERKRSELLKLNRELKLKEKEKENTVVISTAIPKRAVWGSSGGGGGGALQQSTDSNDESWCTDCGSTFPREAIVKHMESHGEAFPSLPTGKKKTYNMPLNKKVYQSQIKNPWTK